MKFYLLILFICIIFVGCSKSKVPEDSQIFAKHIIFNEEITRKIIDTIDAPLFTKYKEFHYIFKFNNNIYKSEYTFTLHPDGSLHRVYYYSGKKSKIYSQIIDSLDINRNEVGKVFWIKLSETHNQIIDGKDTLDIDQIYPEEKLILIKQQKYPGRIIYYEYKKKYNKVEEESPDFKRNRTQK